MTFLNFGVKVGATSPVRSTEGSAGFDLSAFLDEAVTIPSGKREAIHTGVFFMGCSPYIAPHIEPRSGLALRHGIDVLAGVIDSDYRGELIVILQNNGEEDFVVNSGDRIAQLVPRMIANDAVVTESALADESSIAGETERGAGGFGSTGK